MSLYQTIWAVLLAHPSMCQLYTFQTHTGRQFDVFARSIAEAATVADKRFHNAGPLTLLDVHYTRRTTVHAN